MSAYKRLNEASGGHDPSIPLSLSTLVGLLDGDCPDVEDVIQFYETYLRNFPDGLATIHLQANLTNASKSTRLFESG